MTRRRFVFLAGSIIPALLVAVPLLLGVRTAAQSLPSRLSDQEFWKLVTDLSEPDGTFRSDNLLSNEVWLQYVIPELLKTAKTGRVYMGVGPEQNFTYMTAMKPSMAFIVDIRRGNLDLHLVYKALFEMSADRADFVSRLFSRKRPTGLTDKSTAEEIFEAFGERREERGAVHREPEGDSESSSSPNTGSRSRTSIGRGSSTSTTRFPHSARTSSTRPPAPGSSAAAGSRPTRI